MNNDRCSVENIAFSSLPYEQLPDFGIYLDQMLSIVNEALSPVLSEPITSPMINNYIKHKALPSAIKKRYYRDHVCKLLIIGILKTVFSVQQIAKLLSIIDQADCLDSAYARFCSQFETALNGGLETFVGSDFSAGECSASDLLCAMARTAAYRMNAEAALKKFE